MTSDDEKRLAKLLDYATGHPIGADAVLAMQRGARSVVGNDPNHRAFLSEGVILIFSFEDFSKCDPDPPVFFKRSKVRHASISQQVVINGYGGVGNVVPSKQLIDEITKRLGFTDKKFVAPSPERAGPLIQHVLEEL